MMNFPDNPLITAYAQYKRQKCLDEAVRRVMQGPKRGHSTLQGMYTCVDSNGICIGLIRQAFKRLMEERG